MVAVSLDEGSLGGAAECEAFVREESSKDAPG